MGEKEGTHVERFGGEMFCCGSYNGGQLGVVCWAFYVTLFFSLSPLLLLTLQLTLTLCSLLSLLSTFCFSCADMYGFFFSFFFSFLPSFVLRMLGMIAAAGDYLHTLFEFICFSFLQDPMTMGTTHLGARQSGDSFREKGEEGGGLVGFIVSFPMKRRRTVCTAACK